MIIINISTALIPTAIWLWLYFQMFSVAFLAFEKLCLCSQNPQIRVRTLRCTVLSMADQQVAVPSQEGSRALKCWLCNCFLRNEMQECHEYEQNWMLIELFVCLRESSTGTLNVKKKLALMETSYYKKNEIRLDTAVSNKSLNLSD